MNSPKKYKLLRYLTTLKSPYLHEKIVGKVFKNGNAKKIATLKKIINKKELSLKSKPKLNHTNVKNNFEILKKYTNPITQSPISMNLDLLNLSIKPKNLKTTNVEDITYSAMPYRPFNLFKTETIQEKKAREFSDLIYHNKAKNSKRK